MCDPVSNLSNCPLLSIFILAPFMVIQFRLTAHCKHTSLLLILLRLSCFCLFLGDLDEFLVGTTKHLGLLLSVRASLLRLPLYGLFKES